MSNSIKIVDVFSGAGGLSLGWLSQDRSIDVEIIAAIDCDPNLEPVWENNHPNTQFMLYEFGDPLDRDDATAISRRLSLDTASVDVILAGPPCQTFSAAGKRALTAESRHVFHVCSIAKVIQPKAIVIENVPQFGRVLDGRLLGRVSVALAEAGYNTAYSILSASDFGVPQRRSRFFILAVRSDLRQNDPHSILDYCVTMHSTQPEVSVEEAIDDLPPLAAGESLTEYLRPPRSVYQAQMRGTEVNLSNHIAVRHSTELVSKLSKLAPGESPQRTLGHPLRRKAYFRNAYARMDPHTPAPTMTTQTQNPGSGRFTHYRDARVLTVREVARIQSFPDSFKFFGPQEVQRRHVGNAVPPLLSKAIADAVLPILIE